VGLDLNEIDYIRIAVDKIYRFNHIFIVNAGSAISCNCGAGTFGLLFSRNNNYPIDLDIEEFSTANVDDVNLLNEVNAIMAEESSYYGESELTESDDYQGYYEEDDVAFETYDVNESSSEEEFDKKDEKPSSGDSMIDRLSAIEGLETDVGLKYCMNNKDFYLMVIQEYVKKNKLSILDECLKSEDYDNYRINVHALKSTSLNIGAKELSQKAKASEVAIKEGDTDYAKEHHEELIKEYKEMLNSINEVLS
jgi:HPt (histidine-containing phosphotransfer) domain-containing protein